MVNQMFDELIDILNNFAAGIKKAFEKLKEVFDKCEQDSVEKQTYPKINHEKPRMKHYRRQFIQQRRIHRIQNRR